MAAATDAAMAPTVLIQDTGEQELEDLLQKAGAAPTEQNKKCVQDLAAVIDAACLESAGVEMPADGAAPVNLEELQKSVEGKHATLFKQLHTDHTGTMPLLPDDLTPTDIYILKCIDDGEFNIRDRVGQKFQRHAKATPSYPNMTPEEKKTFRKQFLVDLAAPIVQKREKFTEEMKKFFTKGTYGSFSKLVENQGGWSRKCDIEAATRQASKELILGPPFTKWNSFTERVDFLILESGFEESFTKSWRLHEQQTSSPDQPGGGGGGGAAIKATPALPSQTTEPLVPGKRAIEDEEPNVPGTRVGTGKNKKVRKQSGAGAPGARSSADPAGSAKSALSIALASALKTKMAYEKATQQAALLCDRIEKVESYGVLNNPKLKGYPITHRLIITYNFAHLSLTQQIPN